MWRTSWKRILGRPLRATSCSKVRLITLWVRGGAVGPGEHEVEFGVVGAQEQPLLGLRAPPGGEGADDVVVHVDGPPTVRGVAR